MEEKHSATLVAILAEMQKLQEASQRQLAEQQRQIKEQQDAAEANESKVTQDFAAFDSTAELWVHYQERFETFAQARGITRNNKAAYFLSCQTPVIYKQLCNFASQQETPLTVNHLSYDQIAQFMKEQYNPTKFLVRERFKFWSSIGRNQGESIPQLVARIRQLAATCNFANIINPLDEALRTHFICSIKNEAVLKALFKCKNEDLTFARAVEIATETEEAAKVAKETAVGPSKSPISLPINKLAQQQSEFKSSAPRQNKSQTESTACRSCGKSTHERKNCRFKGAECKFCGKNGHIEAVCFKKKAESRKTVKPIFIYGQTKALCQVNQINVDDEITQNLQINGRSIRFELDTGAPTNFITRTLWQSLGKPHLQSSDLQFEGKYTRES